MDEYIFFLSNLVETISLMYLSLQNNQLYGTLYNTHKLRDGTSSEYILCKLVMHETHLSC